MTIDQLSLALVLASLVGCGDPTDSSSVPDASTSVGNCGGGDRFVLDGPVMFTTSSVGPVTTNNKVSGVAGLLGTSELYTFSARNPLVDLDALGPHDVASVNLKYLRGPQGADCSTAAGGCRGFFALAGTYTVIEVQPRYRATFELSDLRERTDYSNQPGPAMAGTITGCLDVDR
jgi:hypothetical protein